MRLVCIHPGDEWYGADKMLFAWIRTFQDEGWEVTVLLPDDVAYEARLSQRLAAVGVDVQVIGLPIVRRRYLTARGVAYLVKALAQSRKQLQRVTSDADVVLYSTSAVVLTALLTKKISGTRVLHLQEYLGTGYLGVVLGLLIRATNSKVVCCSEAVRQGLRGVPASRIEVLRNGSLLEEEDQTVNGAISDLSSDTPPESYSLVLVGRVQAWKGQDQAVRALAKLAASGSPARMALIGGEPPGEEGAYIPALVQLAKDLGVSDRVHFLGQLDPPTVEATVNHANVVMCLSTKPDPFPIAALEAMRSGKAIVASNSGGLPEMIGHAGVLVDPYDVDGVAKQLGLLLQNEKLQISLGFEARSRWETHFAPAAHRERIRNYFKLNSDVGPERFP